MDIFTIIYFIAIVIEIAIRTPLNIRRRQEKISEHRVTAQEKTLFGLLWVGMFAVPILYALNVLDFVDYRLPIWAGWLGVIIIAGAVFIFWRAHRDLGLNWSPSLEIHEKHELITRGIYGVIRHPMYTSQFLWVIAQPLLLQNWIAGFLDLLVYVPFYYLRVKPEEQLMVDAFGDQYRAYMKKVGGVIPRFGQ